MNSLSDSALISYLKRMASPGALYFLSVMLPLAVLGFSFKFSAPPPLPLTAVQQPLPEPEAGNAPDGYTRLSVLSLFAPRPQKEPAPLQQDESDDQMLRAPESTLPVKVTGLLSSNVESHSIAIVQHNQQQLTLGVGEALPDTTATIVRIFPQRIIIRHRGKFEALTMK
ncbi:type II secretion system protein N [Erwinia amylovora]|uniref:Type II secretion system protein outC n=1 Tax=Erwinia amylovora ATCC BAA-2158 TaxID=889211 RepID=E5B8E7_ERWAM|nr:type II secretion system protein N [Erwinia amylovora]CBX81752.1 Type II secretion system protein outC [Erwinia amylovora ATCC BAA-2158]